MGNYDQIARNTWVGIGTKIGGGLIAAGIESTTGVMFNIFNPGWNRMFSIESVRLQIGVGGGIGAVVVIVFNCGSIFAIDKMDVADWGVNFTLGPNWTGIVKNLTKIGFFGSAIRVKNILKSAQSIEELKGARVLGKLAPSDMEGIKNGVNYFWNANDIYKRDGQPMISALDIPGASLGAEISISPIIRGTFNVLPG